MKPIKVVSKKRTAWCDLVRVAACLMVVLVHANPYWWETPEYSWNWLLAAFLASLARVCVPLFFLLSGSLNLKPEIEVVNFLKSRVLRLIVPWLFWSLVYITYRKFDPGDQISIASTVRLLITGDVYYHLWFLYALAGVYLGIPFVSPILADNRRQLVRSACLLWLCVTVILPFLGQHISKWTGVNCTVALSFPAMTGFLGMALCGAWVCQWSYSRLRVLIAVVCFVLAVLLTFALTVNVSIVHGKSQETFFGYMQPLVVVASMSLFYLLRWTPLYESSVLKNVADLSLGIYLVHPLVIPVLEPRICSSFDNAFLGIPILVVSVFIVSAVVVYFLSRVPYVRRVVV